MISFFFFGIKLHSFIHSFGQFHVLSTVRGVNWGSCGRIARLEFINIESPNGSLKLK